MPPVAGKEGEKIFMGTFVHVFIHACICRAVRAFISAFIHACVHSLGFLLTMCWVVHRNTKMKRFPAIEEFSVYQTRQMHSLVLLQRRKFPTDV